MRCAPRHSLARWQRANPNTRIKSDGFGECGLSDVSDVSAAITGPNVEAAPASAANHGRCHRCRAARRAGLWLAPRVWYLLKVARPIGRRTTRGRRALALVSPAHPQRGRSDVRGVYCRSRGPSQASPARRSQSLRPVPRSTARIRAVGIDFPSQWGAFSQVGRPRRQQFQWLRRDQPNC